MGFWKYQLPPTSSEASKHVCGTPKSSSALHAVRPLTPAPMMQTDGSSLMESDLRPALLTQRATTLASLACAGVLVAIKLGAGLLTGSLGLISSGIESSGDVVAADLTFFAVGLGARPADFEHPYGHRRAENLGALGEAAILLGGGVLVGVAAIVRLASAPRCRRSTRTSSRRSRWRWRSKLTRLGVALLAARRFRSPALRANAWHFANDLAASLAVLAGLLAVQRGLCARATRSRRWWSRRSCS